MCVRGKGPPPPKEAPRSLFPSQTGVGFPAMPRVSPFLLTPRWPPCGCGWDTLHPLPASSSPHPALWEPQAGRGELGGAWGWYQARVHDFVLHVWFAQWFGLTCLCIL